MAKTLQEQLKEAEQRIAEQELKASRLRERITKEEARKAKVLVKVIQKAVKTAEHKRQIGQILHHHSDDKDREILSEFLGISVSQTRPVETENDATKEKPNNPSSLKNMSEFRSESESETALKEMATDPFSNI